MLVQKPNNVGWSSHGPREGGGAVERKAEARERNTQARYTVAFRGDELEEGGV